MVFIKDRKSNSERGRKSSQSFGSINLEDSIFFSCSAKRLDQTTIDLGELFSRQSADQLIREHLKKNRINVHIYCLDDRILFEKNRSMLIRSIRKFVFYEDITNFYVFSSKPGVFMLCIHDKLKRKKTYESFMCDEYKDVDKLSKLINSAKLNPDYRLRRSWDIDGHFANANGSTQEQIVEIIGRNGLSREMSTERDIIIVESRQNAQNSRLSEARFNQANTQASREIILRHSSSVLRNGNDGIWNYQSEKDVIIPVRLSKSRKYNDNQQKLNNIFQNELTFISALPSGNVEVCDRGPVFLYSSRMPDRLETYKGPIRLSDYEETAKF